MKLKKTLLIILIAGIAIAAVVIMKKKSPDDIYPFSEADKIDLVFYKEPISGGLSENAAIADIAEKIITLTPWEKQEVFDILYNNKNCFVNYAAACFDPRHAIVFYSKGDKIGMIEICLECAGIKSTRGVGEIDLCESKFKDLDAFFNQVKNKMGR